jgi:hypothetical protein
LTVTGDIVAGAGDLSGHVIMPSIGTLLVGGSMKGALSVSAAATTSGGFVSVSNSLGNVTIGGNLEGDAKIYAGGLKDNKSIRNVLIKGDVNDGEILAGYVADLGQSGISVSTVNADAQIDSVQVDGSVLKFDLLAGSSFVTKTNVTTSQSTSGYSSEEFGRNDPTVYSRIARVIFNGAILDNPEEHYVSAQSIGSIIAHGVPVTASVAPGTEIVPGSKFMALYPAAFIPAP